MKAKEYFNDVAELVPQKIFEQSTSMNFWYVSNTLVRSHNPMLHQGKSIGFSLRKN